MDFYSHAVSFNEIVVFSYDVQSLVAELEYPQSKQSFVTVFENRARAANEDMALVDIYTSNYIELGNIESQSSKEGCFA